MSKCPIIQYAGGAALDDDQLRARLTHAPAWFRQSVDTEREQRGLKPLYAVRAAVAGSWSPTPPAAPVKLPKPVHTLTVIAAPGISEPVAMRAGEPAMPEHISGDAWRSALATIRGGREIPIQCGHGAAAHVLARSGTPQVRFTVSDVVGLVLEVDLRDGDTARRPDCASIGFTPLKWHVEHHRGMPVRIIDAMRLDHIALGEAWNLQPAYKLSTVRRSIRQKARAAVIDAVAATMAEMRRACPHILAR